MNSNYITILIIDTTKDTVIGYIPLSGTCGKKSVVGFRRDHDNKEYLGVVRSAITVSEGDETEFIEELNTHDVVSVVATYIRQEVEQK